MGLTAQLATELLLSQLGTSVLVQYDQNSQSLVRNKHGRCVPCKAGQLGELLGLRDNETYSRASQEAGSSTTTSSGGASARASARERVLARDVFRAGDVYIRTGDLMVMDERGFYYYVDRIGNSISKAPRVKQAASKRG